MKRSLLALCTVLAVAACDPSAAAPAPGVSTAGPSTAASPAASSMPSFVRPTPTPVPTPVLYVVVRGDTLTSIARVFGTTPRSIALWNRERYPTLDPTSSRYAPDAIAVGWGLLVTPGVVFDENDPPTASASANPSAPGTPAPTPRPSASATPRPSTGSTISALVSHGPRGTATIALTFDMGGRLDPALDIVDWLVAHDVHATFFPTGVMGTTTATGRAVLAAVAAHPELFGLGNHSWDHPSFIGLTASQIADQLGRTESAIEDVAGLTTKPWFRPPYGAQNVAVRTAVGAAGWGTTVMWDVDTIDWKPESDGGPSVDDIVTKVLSRSQGGSIVLMHLGGYNTLAALPRIVADLGQRHLQPVTLSEMLGA